MILTDAMLNLHIEFLQKNPKLKLPSVLFGLSMLQHQRHLTEVHVCVIIMQMQT